MRNPYFIDHKQNVAIMITPQGDEVYLDLEDLEMVKSLSGTWQSGSTRKDNSPYCYATNGSGKTLYLHREVMGLKPGDPMVVDHRNENKMDNRKCNLQIVERSTNRSLARPEYRAWWDAKYNLPPVPEYHKSKTLEFTEGQLDKRLSDETVNKMRKYCKTPAGFKRQQTASLKRWYGKKAA